MKNKKLVIIAVITIIAIAIVSYMFDFIRSRPKTDTIWLVIDEQVIIVNVAKVKPIGFGYADVIDVDGESYRVSIDSINYAYPYGKDGK